MYEDKTIENIHSIMLSGINDTYEKSVGYPTFDITKSFAIATNFLYSRLQEEALKVHVKNLTGKELEERVWDMRGLKRKKATFAKGTLQVMGSGVISIGNLFSTSKGIQFKSLENKVINGTDTINIKAVQAGIIGVVGANTIVQMPITIQGITKCTNLSATYDGYGEEVDEELKQRYYDALQIPATSNNKYHFLKWAKDVTGVGDAKVFPCWNGNLTVKVAIIDVNKQPANVELVKRVQNYIDPNEPKELWGTGSGQSNLGSFCTVVSAMQKDINVTVNIKKISNFEDDEVKTNINKSIVEFLKTIAFKEDYVSYGLLGNAILNSNGVKDYNTLNINGGITNVNIGAEEVGILKSLVINYV